MAPLGVKEQGRAKRPAVWGGAARPATQAADASRGGGEAGDREGAESSWSGREGEVPTAEDGAHGRSSDDVKAAWCVSILPVVIKLVPQIQWILFLLNHITSRNEHEWSTAQLAVVSYLHNGTFHLEKASRSAIQFLFYRHLFFE
ncbi:uncharacterized protein [Triticum aestivum]|uniref:uncharacterized protein isoform X1 n=1 Tax=Triticum aestivum TaxID=4565 RepID=UPI001D007DAD|nr:uncharacterized protein LOC123078286 isoform X1 [Triticum aestivum]